MSSDTTVSILRKGLERLQRRGGWTRLLYAADQRGEPAATDSSGATCWCAVGAIDNDYDAGMALAETLGFECWRPIIHWNDDQPDADPVIMLYQRTIARLEKAGSE